VRGWLLVLLAGCGGSLQGQVWIVTDAPLEDADPAWRVTEVVRDDPASEADALLEEARRHAVAFRSDEALAVLGRAQVLLETQGRGAQDFDALARTWALRALIESNLEHAEQSEEALRIAARLRPDAELDPVVFPPDLRERHAALRAAARAEPPATRAVTTEPPGARIYLDGREVGTTPATVSAPAGRHYLRVVAPMHAARTLVIELGGSDEPVRVALPAPEDLAAHVLEVADLAALEVEASYLVRIDEATEGVAVGEGRHARRPGVAVREVLDELRRPPTGRRWGIALAALAVAAGVVTAVLLTREPDPVFRIETVE